MLGYMVVPVSYFLLRGGRGVGGLALGAGSLLAITSEGHLMLRSPPVYIAIGATIFVQWHRSLPALS